MKPSLRQVLAESHVAAVAIVMLLIGSAVWVLQLLLWLPASDAIGDWHNYAAADFTDAAYFFRNFRPSLQSIIPLLPLAISYVVAAWILSHMVYGVGPFRVLIALREKLMRNRDA
jgi:hypothetical protein